MKVAVTGGDGFIGRAVVAQLQARNHDTVVLDRSSMGIAGDVTSPHVGDTLKLCDAVVHLAGVLGTSELLDTVDTAVDVNIKGTLRVLEACRDHDLAFVGITVPDPGWPSVYQATKLAAERLAKAFHQSYGVPVTHIRAFNAYGEGQAFGQGHPQKIVPTFASRSWRGLPMPVWGDGEQRVDLVHVNFVAKCLAAAVRTDQRNYGHGHTFDAGSGTTFSVNDVVRSVGKVTGSHVVEYLPMRDGELSNTVICAQDFGPCGYDTFDEARFTQVVQSYRTPGAIRYVDGISPR